MIQAIRDGRPGTAMAAFSNRLSEHEITAVADFVRDEFIRKKAVNTRYHTAEAGWPNHDRYRAAFPFATGEIPLDTPEEKLAPEQLAGRQLFMTSCVSCHDRAKVNADPVQWELRAVSYPPNVDACTGCHKYSVDLHPGTKPPHPEYAYPRITPAEQASPYKLHDTAPHVAGMNALERRGEKLFQQNCTFCHAADGTGKNWIGAFLEPHPRDLTDGQFMSQTTRAKLTLSIREGLPETSMPAWKTVLKDDEVNAIVAYIGRAFYPALR
jgi:cytochrome c oxidase cbb3-type subunit 3